MASTTFNKHEKVTIYQDPITEQHEEGKAELISFERSFYDLEHWIVRFIGEQRRVQRSVSTCGKNRAAA